MTRISLLIILASLILLNAAVLYLLIVCDGWGCMIVVVLFFSIPTAVIFLAFYFLGQRFFPCLIILTLLVVAWIGFFGYFVVEEFSTYVREDFAFQSFGGWLLERVYGDMPVSNGLNLIIVAYGLIPFFGLLQTLISLARKSSVGANGVSISIDKQKISNSSRRSSRKAWFAIIFFILLVAAGITFVYRDRLFSKKSEIIETRDFSCPGMSGFTFKYPVFKGWEVVMIKSSGKNGCVISLNVETLTKSGAEFSPISTLSPQILIIRYGDNSAQPPERFTQSNANRIYFDETDLVGRGYDFWTGDSVVTLRISDVSKKLGFDSEQFFKTVIESFKLIEDDYRCTDDRRCI